jgi:hypothetical protein
MFHTKVNAKKARCMVMSEDQNAGQNSSIHVGNKFFERVEQFKYLGTALRSQNSIHEGIKSRLKSGNACCHLGQNLSYSLLSKSVKIKIHRIITLPVVLQGSETW